MLPINYNIILASIVLAVSAQEWANFNCVAPRSPRNGMSFIFDDGQKVEFRCHPGYKMVGTNFAECKRNRWTVPPPRCVPLTANQRSTVITDEMATPYPRSVFDWQSGQPEENQEPLSVRYGSGSNRLPIINGLWGYPTHRDSRVLSIVPDTSHGNTASAKELVEQEMSIATLRHQMEQDVIHARGLEPKKDPTPPPYYSPYKINSDGYLVGIGGVSSHPIYYLGASLEHKVDENYRNTRIGPDLAELRRRQIEEARNIQMNAANNRQRRRFQNTLTYGSRDIPVWKGRQNSGGYWTEETVYKPARVGMTKYAEQNRFYVHAPLNDPLFPRSNPAPRSEELSARSPYRHPTVATTVSTTETQSFTVDHNADNEPSTSFTRHKIVSNIPTPTALVTNQTPSSLVLVNDKELPPMTIASSAPTTHRQTTVNMPESKTKYEDFEWPAEALWFKDPTTTSRPQVATSPLRRWTTQRPSKGNKSHGRRVNKNRNRKLKEKRPQVTHFSHGRVKSTETEGGHRIN